MIEQAPAPRPPVPRLWLLPLAGLCATAVAFVIDVDRFAPSHVTLGFLMVGGFVAAIVHSLGSAERSARALANETIENLRDREARLEAVFHAVPDLFVFLGVDGIILDLRGGASADFHRAPERFLGRPFAEVLPPSVSEAISAGLAGVHSTGQSVTIEYGRATPNGDDTFEARFLPLGAAQVLMVARNITERRTAETAFRQTLSLMQSIVEHSPSMISVKDAQDLRFVVFNRAGEALLGYERDEIIGKNAYDLFSPAEADYFTAKDREVLARGWSLDTTQEPIQTRYKGRRHLRTARVPIKDLSGRPQYLLGISEDITARMRMEDDLRESQKMEAIGTLAGGIAHDFNNILASVIGFSELARMDSSDPRVLANLESVLAAGERAKGLVEQIVAFSRQQAPDLQPLALAAAVEDAIKLVRATLPAPVTIAAELAADLPPVLADATQVHQLVMNLATNGAQAMAGDGGRLRIALERVNVSREFAAPQRGLFPGEYVRLVVADTGAGMDAATLARVFEPFFTTKPPGQGTGLGLSVVHGIVKSHTGAIFVDSQPHYGTTFAVYFPAYQGPLPAGDSPPPAVPRGHGEHILFVDDESAIVEAQRGLLERLGYRVTGVSDPAEAVRIFRMQPEDFDLVLTDSQMPGLSGTDLAQVLLRIRPGVRILLSTGFAGRVTPEAARAIGLQGLLLKPATMGALACAVKSALAPTDPHSR